MASIVTTEGKTLYVLVNSQTGIIWLASIATNTADPWKHAEQFATRKTLKDEGWVMRPASLKLESWPVTTPAKSETKKVKGNAKPKD